MIILYVFAVALSFLIFKRVTYIMRGRALAKKWNCEEPHNLNEFPLNLPLFFLIINAARKHVLLDTLLGLFRQFSPTKTVKQVLLGSFTVIPTNDPENIKAVLATQFKDFCLGQRHAQLAPILGDGIFTLDGQGWQHSRAMLRPQFARDQVSDVEMIERHVQAFLLRVPNNKKFDIQELFFNLTLDTATEFLFGQTVGSQTVNMANEDSATVSDMPKEMRKTFQEDFNTAQHHGGIRTRFQMFYWIWRPAALFASAKRVHKFVDHYVEKALANSDDEKNDDKYIFLRELAREVKDPVVLRDQSLNILLAGRDTTAGVLSWIVYELARHPEVWKKLRAEIHQDFGDGSDLSVITFEGLKRCEYLRYIINETLRLYPSVPLNVRYAARDTTLPRGGGPDESKPILVRKGDTIVYNVFSMHRTAEFWGDDCDVFRPERWAEKVSRGWEYLPFNGGPRICLGQQYALTETSYVIARIAQLFTKIENADDAPEPPAKLHALTLCHLNGVQVKMTRDEAAFKEANLALGH